MKVISDKSKTITTVRRTVKREVGKFVVSEYIENDKLLSQSWFPKKGDWKDLYPRMYEPKHCNFQYYDDISFLDSEENCNYTNFYDIIPNPKCLKNWNEFKSFDHVLFISLGNDGNIYSLAKKDPVPLWRHKDYISGFCNDNYDLKRAKRELEKYKWIRNLDIVDIPYYNRFDGETKALEFDYKLPSKRHLEKKLNKNKMFKDHYFGF